MTKTLTEQTRSRLHQLLVAACEKHALEYVDWTGSVSKIASPTAKGVVTVGGAVSGVRGDAEGSICNIHVMVSIENRRGSVLMHADFESLAGGGDCWKLASNTIVGNRSTVNSLEECVDLICNMFADGD